MAGANRKDRSSGFQSGIPEEQLTVKGLADEPMKFLMFGVSDCHLEDLLLPKEQNSLVHLPPFVDLTQLLKPIYIPLSLIEQPGINTSKEQITATEEQIDATRCTSEEQMCATNIPEERLCSHQEQINVTDSPKEKLYATSISEDRTFVHLGERNRKRARDESNSPDTLSLNDYTCIESDPASESVIDLTQDSP